MPTVREIVEDFAKEIQSKKISTAKPSTTVIKFRTDIKDGIERPVEKVPLECLRFRKDNGRIASDVMDHEKKVGPLDEKDLNSQTTIRHFLANKDPEKTNILTKTIMHEGQREPAIITCDGFLVDGNRRKVVMDKLHEEYPGHEEYEYMKVVILPGAGDEGGPPTLLEIEKIENRIQLQSDGRSEYYKFDRAISIVRKIETGFSLEEQLSDDPQYAGASKAELARAVRNYERDYLRPLECIDRYLHHFHRDGLYSTVSSGISDREGRWQAFSDYSKSYDSCFNNPRKRLKLGIEEEDIGAIEDAAFKMIRLRVLKGLPKLYTIMRDLPKWCGNDLSKKEILEISDEVDETLPQEEYFDKDGDALSMEDIDSKWAAKYQQPIIHHAKKASQYFDDQAEQETPINL